VGTEIGESKGFPIGPFTGRAECGFVSINVPAGFEQMMPQLVEVVRENPLSDVDDT